MKNFEVVTKYIKFQMGGVLLVSTVRAPALQQAFIMLQKGN